MSNVYFTDLRARPGHSLLDKIENLLMRAKIGKQVKKKDLLAIKLHFGEPGNCAFLRPVFVRTVVDHLAALGCRPFLTDTNTLYTGPRANSVTHIQTAIRNGFDYAVVGCPVIIADGVRGTSGVRVPIEGELLREVSIARDIVDADGLVVLTHFKGHELSGFGGALKNLGMGCATREGKLLQHSTVAPSIDARLCKGCSLCLDYCPANAISLKGRKASIEGHKCIGCGECLVICPRGAVQVEWNEASDNFQKKMAEHAAGALAGKAGKAVFLNFLVDISPACDCYPHNDAPIVKDIGILASGDPVAVDAASVGLVNGEESLPGTAIKRRLKKGEDKFRAVYPAIDWNVQLDHAQRMGLGDRAYRLVKV